MKIEKYSICSPIKNTCKSYGVWVQEGNSTSPLIYLQKPKWVDDEKWEEIVHSIKLELPYGYEI